MLLRTALLAAIVAAPMALTPATASAQERGIDRATTVSANAPAHAHGLKNRVGKGIPKGVARVFTGGNLPPGIARTRDAASSLPPEVETPPVPPDEDPQPEPAGGCTGGIIVVGGIPMPCTP